MANTLTNIARTISEELERAVAAAEQSQNAGIDAALRDITAARRKRNDALARCDEMQRNAASIIAEALKLRERAEIEFNEAMDAASTGLDALKVPERIRVTAPPPQAIEGAMNGAAYD